MEATMAPPSTTATRAPAASSDDASVLSVLAVALAVASAIVLLMVVSVYIWLRRRHAHSIVLTNFTPAVEEGVGPWRSRARRGPTRAKAGGPSRPASAPSPFAVHRSSLDLWAAEIRPADGKPASPSRSPFDVQAAAGLFNLPPVRTALPDTPTLNRHDVEAGGGSPASRSRSHPETAAETAQLPVYSLRPNPAGDFSSPNSHLSSRPNSQDLRGSSGPLPLPSEPPLPVGRAYPGLKEVMATGGPPTCVSRGASMTITIPEEIVRRLDELSGAENRLSA